MIALSELCNVNVKKEIQGNLQDGKYKISTDSRKYEGEKIFIALKGEKYDAFDFVEKVLQKSCPAVVFTNTAENIQKSQDYFNKYPSTLFISVSDTVLFLQKLASSYIGRWLDCNKRNKIVGITGSSGKTTNKEMLFHYLRSVLGDRVHCNLGNLNNHIGVPLTLLDVEDKHEVAIVEMGTNHPGEILLLSQIAHPNCGIITNIGTAHLEFLKSQQGIFNEKRSLFDEVMKNTENKGIFVLDEKDPYLCQLPHHEHVIFFNKIKGGRSSAFFQIDKDKVIVEKNGESFCLENKHVTGEHNFKNLVATFILALELYPEKAHIFEQCSADFRPQNNRSLWLHSRDRTYSVFLDAYNANPSSMEASVKGFDARCNDLNIPQEKRFYILGDMKELGGQGAEFHQQIGKLLRDLAVTNAGFVGEFAEDYMRGYGGKSLNALTAEEFKNKYWEELKTKHTYFFIKGSRSLQLEKIVDIKELIT